MLISHLRRPPFVYHISFLSCSFITPSIIFFVVYTHAQFYQAPVSHYLIFAGPVSHYLIFCWCSVSLAIQQEVMYHTSCFGLFLYLTLSNSFLALFWRFPSFLAWYFLAFVSHTHGDLHLPCHTFYFRLRSPSIIHYSIYTPCTFVTLPISRILSRAL